MAHREGDEFLENIHDLKKAIEHKMAYYVPVSLTEILIVSYSEV